MTPSRAKEVLEGMGFRVMNDKSLRCHTPFVYAINANGEVTVQGSFNADQLQAIARWMQDPEGVTNA